MLKLVSWKTCVFLCVLCPLSSITLPGQTFMSLVNFDVTNGATPYEMALVQGTDGNLWGTTEAGGTQNLGTVFKMTPTGTLTTVYSFCALSGCSDGAEPLGGLTLGTDGNFYGTTGYDGASGYGTVFRITPGGALTTLHSFAYDEGAFSNAPPIQATNGAFYGTTFEGGEYGYGSLYKITSQGAFTLLFSFDGTDGEYPVPPLIQATNGNLYGITEAGGPNGVGTVFQMTLAGTVTTLYNFCSQAGCADGSYPQGGLIQASNGSFYGTTDGGGTFNAGIIFKMTPGGVLTSLHSFCAQSDCTDGVAADGSLVQATDGNFYGVTGGDGLNWGTVYELTSGGTFTTLQSFDLTDGAKPFAGLVQATGGTFYGATYEGGSSTACNNYESGCGTVFSISVGLGPFVALLPTSGKAGATVKILGNNLTGATSVTFNGMSANFTVVSSTEIKSTVPPGATTGYVKVTTAGGTILTSNVKFRVL